MDFDNLYNKIITGMTPSNYSDSGKSFYDHLCYCLDEYSDNLDKTDDIPEKEYIQDKVSQLSQGIKSVVWAYLHGQHYTAFKTLLTLMEADIELLIKRKANEAWYRMREIENAGRVTCKDMFHIPMHMRGLVKTQRYSSPGYPCLYLGKHILTCWEEMGKPHLDNSFVSRYLTEKEFWVLDMSVVPFNDIDDDTLKVNFLCRVPLIIASMIKVKNKDDVFKPEYIIPQLLMEWILYQGKNNTDDKKNPIGIYYTSVFCDDDFGFNMEEEEDVMMDNLAIPVFSTTKEDYCQELCHLFTLTHPTCDERERVKKPYTVHTSHEESDKYFYRYSTFGILEKRLEQYFDLYAIDEHGNETLKRHAKQIGKNSNES